MKKKWKMFVVSIGITLFITGCGLGGISAEDAGNLFVDRLVYQKEEAKFANKFLEGQQVGKRLDENSEAFEEDFTTGLSSTGAEVPEDETAKLTKELLQQVKQKTSYKIVKVDETKTGATITYYVTGLDFVSVMQEMTRELIKQSITNPEIAQDEEKTVQATFHILEELVQSIKIKNDPVELTIHLEKEKGKWVIPKDQQEAVSNLFMAFISGTKDADTMNSELEEALSMVVRESIGSLNQQPSN